MNRVDDVNWPPERYYKGDVSSVSPLLLNDKNSLDNLLRSHIRLANKVGLIA